MISNEVAAGVLLALAGGAVEPLRPARRLLRVQPGAAAAEPLRPGSGESAGSEPPRVSVLAFAAAGLAVAVLLGGWLGALAAIATVWFGPVLVARLETRAERDRRRRLADELPVAVDLLAACLLAGAGPEQALRSVAAALAGPVGEVFGAVAAATSVGADPRAAGAPWGVDPAFAGLARAVVRAEVSGAPLATVLTRAAADLRAARRIAAEAAARRVGVLAVAPLGLCFLPGFILLSVVPVVSSLAASAFGPSP